LGRQRIPGIFVPTHAEVVMDGSPEA